jgi:phage replication initiation protein
VKSRLNDVSPNTPVIRGHSGAGQSSVDWLNATFPSKSISVGKLMEELRPTLAFRSPLEIKAEGGRHGFTERYSLRGEYGLELGAIYLGGIAQRDRTMLQITGRGCQSIKNWWLLKSLLEALDAKITRLDIAVDFTEGQFDIEDAIAMFERGEFSVRGRKPSVSVAGDWLQKNDGRSLYIGKPDSGKVLCVYEKGLQQKLPLSRWVRFELRLGKRRGDLPLEAIVETDSYFAGAYPALANILPQATPAAVARREKKVTDLSGRIHHLRRSYKGTIAEALSTTGADRASLMEYLVPHNDQTHQQDNPVSWAEVQQDLGKRSRRKG